MTIIPLINLKSKYFFILLSKTCIEKKYTSILNNYSTKYKIMKLNMILLGKSINNLVNNSKDSYLEMVDRRRDKNYIRKGIRIGPKYIVICDFLDFYAGYKGINKFEFYNNLFNYSLKKIPKDIGYKFKKSPAASYGITRSFFLDKKTYNLLHKTYKKSQELYKTLYDDYLSMGNFAELILYIYVTNNIEKKILNIFKFDFGIKKIT